MYIVVYPNGDKAKQAFIAKKTTGEDSYAIVASVNRTSAQFMADALNEAARKKPK